MKLSLPSATRFEFRRSAPGIFFFPSALNCDQRAIREAAVLFKLPQPSIRFGPKSDNPDEFQRRTRTMRKYPDGIN
jgi:hypothetical protein